MSQITVTVTDREKNLLDERARECGMTPEEFVHSSLATVLQAEEEDFERIKSYLFEKYEDLYRRLA